jgi:hypothetical protein
MGKIMEAWGSLYPTNSSLVAGIGAKLDGNSRWLGGTFGREKRWEMGRERRGIREASSRGPLGLWDERGKWGTWADR